MCPSGKGRFYRKVVAAAPVERNLCLRIGRIGDDGPILIVQADHLGGVLRGVQTFCHDQRHCLARKSHPTLRQNRAGRGCRRTSIRIGQVVQLIRIARHQRHEIVVGEHSQNPGHLAGYGQI